MVHLLCINIIIDTEDEKEELKMSELEEEEEKTSMIQMPSQNSLLLRQSRSAEYNLDGKEQIVSRNAMFYRPRQVR